MQEDYLYSLMEYELEEDHRDNGEEFEEYFNG